MLSFPATWFTDSRWVEEAARVESQVWRDTGRPCSKTPREEAFKLILKAFGLNLPGMLAEMIATAGAFAWLAFGTHLISITQNAGQAGCC